MTTSSALDHKTTGFTLSVYGHAVPDRQTETAAKLDAFLDARLRTSEK